MKKGKDSKRKYDSDESKKRLMNAGIDVFAKMGFDGATTRDIAKKAGINEALIHRYFKNKLGLFFAILDQYHEDSLAELSYPTKATLEEELRGFFMSRMKLTHREKQFLRLSMSRAIVDPKVRKYIANFVDAKFKGIANRLQRLCDEKKMRSDLNFEHVGRLISAIAHSATTSCHIIQSISADSAIKILDTATNLLTEALSPRGKGRG